MQKDKIEEVLSHAEITVQEGMNLVKGMNYHPLSKDYSIFLMSVNEDAPYNDGFDPDGNTLTYEGHDITRRENEHPKNVDQPFFTSNGKLTENGKFFKAVEDYKNRRIENPEHIRVYEKIEANVWSDKGFYYLLDADFVYAKNEDRKVFKFKLVPEDIYIETKDVNEEIILSRRIPTIVKRRVWDRDGGKCVECGSTKDLHFDHILPYSKGGTSTNPENIQLLCQKHNLSKSSRIQ